MNRDEFIINYWIPALRSGEYKQGTNLLRSMANEYCCLGVASDLYIKHINPSARWTIQESAYGECEYYYEGPEDYEQCFLPYEIKDFLLISNSPEGPEIKIGNDEYSSLAQANDNGCSFSDIADELERMYKDGEL